MTEIEQIRQVLRKRGWCQIYSNGYFYNTTGNSSPESIVREQEMGWELVGIFAPKKKLALVTDPSVKPNFTVYRRPAPAFFTAENPWAEKGQLSWLPDLTYGVEERLSLSLCVGGHGSPGMARRFRCICGKQEVTCLYNAEDGSAIAECPSCLQRSTVSDVQQEGLPLQLFVCDCGDNRVWIDVGIEYSVGAEEGWDFSWITVAATCCSCLEATILFDDETA